MATQYDSVATDETGDLISSDKVEGTAVYNRGGEKLGSIHSVMIDKRSGKVAYAVMSFGGFLGIGDRYHPLPWNVLTYDSRQGGYVVDLDRSMLEGRRPTARARCRIGATESGAGRSKITTTLDGESSRPRRVRYAVPLAGGGVRVSKLGLGHVARRTIACYRGLPPPLRSSGS
jgi:PRC-barrel domain